MDNFIGSALYTFNIPEPWFSLDLFGSLCSVNPDPGERYF